MGNQSVACTLHLNILPIQLLLLLLSINNNAGPQPPLARLPELNQSHIDDDASGHDAPLPRDRIVLEDEGVDLGKVDDGEGDEEAGGDGEEEEAVVPDGVEDGEGALAPQLGVHGEQGAREVLDLPGGDQQQEAEGGVGGGAGAEDGLAGAVEAVVALVAEAEGPGRPAVDDGGEGGDTQRPHEEAVGHLVHDDLPGEDADAQVVRGPQHDVGLGLLEAEPQRQERRRDQVGPEDLDRREREHRLAALVFEG